MSSAFGIRDQSGLLITVGRGGGGFSGATTGGAGGGGCGCSTGAMFSGRPS